jgi:hypothetical protein
MTPLTSEQRAAVQRCIVTRGRRAGRLKRRPPPMHVDPLGWAAWQGIMTGFGYCTEAVIGGLIMAPPGQKDDMRDTWDRVSDRVLALRRAGAVSDLGNL